MLRRLLIVGIALLLLNRPCAAQVTLSPYNHITDGDVANDESKAATAMAARDAAISNLSAIEKTITDRLQSALEYVSGKMDADAASAAYPSAYDKVIASLADNADYKTACAARDAAAQAVDDARSSGQTGSAVVSLATDAMHARGAVSKIEAAALLADPDYQAAKARLVRTAATLKSLDAKLHGAMLADPQYQTANATVQIAVAQYEAASGAAAAAERGRAQEIQDEINAQARDNLNRHR